MDARVPLPGRRSAEGRTPARRLWVGPVVALIAIAVVGAAPRIASAAANITFDTGSGVAFTISGTHVDDASTGTVDAHG
jgi:hypothetical protein